MASPGQGRALTREYQSQLAHRIGIARVTTRRDKVLWRALKGIDDETLALRLLTAGISVCGSDDLGIDKDGEKNFRDIALWIGRNLGHRGKIGCKVGAWGIDLLLTLPCFALDDEGILRPTARAIDFADDVLAQAVKNNALLSPLLEPPRPWTQVSKGALPPDHWAKVALIRGHRASQAAARKAISDGRMQKVLDAINALQAVPFTINRPILDFLCRAGPKPELSDGELKVWDTDIVTAVAMACSDRFYVPLNMDFRGRIYPIPHFNFTRADPVRALFLLAEGESIGESGLLWLKAHVAARADGNKWSPVEKPSALNLVNRVAWTNDNLETLRNIGEAVLRGDDPADDK
jgi:hypothetical protein